MKFTKDEIYQELKTAHWELVYNWNAVESKIDAAARRADCSVDELRQMMRDIETKYPKPQPKKKRKTWRNIAFKSSCRTCGTLIGFARTDKGKFMPVNLHDFTTHWGCEKPGKRKKKKGGDA